MYFYKSPVGKFTIRRVPSGFKLEIDGAEIAKYPSAVAAADDVFVHCTGYFEWDRLDGKVKNVPPDLSEWAIG